MTLIYTDPLFARHQTPPRHPERSARMGAVLQALGDRRFDGLERRTAEPASYEAIARCHPSSYLERLTASIPESGMIALDPDTHIGPESWRAARLASGAAIAAVDAVVGLEAHNAFVVARPPGHHAERTTAMGFCLINHVAIAARHAQAVHGIERVAIVDFDVHHGNGTQDIFWDDPSVLYASTHQSPLYPGTGSAAETGAGNILNIPVAAGTDGAQYRPLFEAVVEAVAAFRPELVILSAGFDAHADDPLGGMALVEDDYVWITHQMMDLAAQTAHGRVVSVLEGGYDLGALGRSAAAHVGALAGV